MPIDHFFISNLGSSVFHATRVNRIIVVILIDHDNVAVVKLSVILAILNGSCRLSSGLFGLDDFGRCTGYSPCKLAFGNRLLPYMNVAAIELLQLLR